MFVELHWNDLTIANARGGGGRLEAEDEGGGEEEEGRNEVELACDDTRRKARDEKSRVRFEQKVLCTSCVF